MVYAIYKLYVVLTLQTRMLDTTSKRIHFLLLSLVIAFYYTKLIQMTYLNVTAV